MRYQQIKDKIHSLRMLSGQNELKTDILMLDDIELFLEHKSAIVSVIGAKASGKCSLVNSLIASDYLPTGIFKSRTLYEVKTETSGFPFEIKTGFDIDDKCSEMGYMLSDIVVLCLKATALWSLDDVRTLEELRGKGHKNIILCVTHLNNVKTKELPEIVRYVTSKQPDLPVVYYSDEELAEVPEEISHNYGVRVLKSTIEASLSSGDLFDQRVQIVEKLIEKITTTLVSDLDAKKLKLVSDRDLKYADHCEKISKKQLIRLGWSEIRVAYEKLERECVETILLQLNKSKAKIIDKLNASIITIPNPKEWWEKMLPIMLKNEIEALANAIDSNIQSRIVRDLNWLNREIQNRFRQSVTASEKHPLDSMTDFEFDPSSYTFKNLRTARYISMAGSSALATLMFFVVGPVGAVVSATCGIISDRYINKVTEGQRDTLRGLVAGVVDEAVGKIADMVPSRVRGLYDEFSNAIGEKEKIWTETYGQDVFECAEDKEIEKINGIINQIESIK